MDASADILTDLLHREPIFHRPAYPAVMTEDYFEIGASGKRYDRAFILEHLAANPPVDAETAGWQITDPHLRPLAADTFLLSYMLNQQPRLTRRSTIWMHTPEGWQILYHQGTVVG